MELVQFASETVDLSNPIRRFSNPNIGRADIVRFVIYETSDDGCRTIFDIIEFDLTSRAFVLPMAIERFRRDGIRHVSPVQPPLVGKIEAYKLKHNMTPEFQVLADEFQLACLYSNLNVMVDGNLTPIVRLSQRQLLEALASAMNTLESVDLYMARIAKAVSSVDDVMQGYREQVLVSN